MSLIAGDIPHTSLVHSNCCLRSANNFLLLSQTLCLLHVYCLFSPINRVTMSNQLLSPASHHPEEPSSRLIFSLSVASHHRDDSTSYTRSFFPEPALHRTCSIPHVPSKNNSSSCVLRLDFFLLLCDPFLTYVTLLPRSKLPFSSSFCTQLVTNFSFLYHSGISSRICLPLRSPPRPHDSTSPHLPFSFLLLIVSLPSQSS